MYYIISLKHTNRQDRHICLWQSNNSGYCSSKELAGVYEDYERGYHDAKDDSMPVKKEKLDGLFIDSIYDSKKTMKKCVPNCKQVWEVLGVKMTKNGLKIINKTCPVCWKKLEDGIVKGMCTNDKCLTNHGISEL